MEELGKNLEQLSTNKRLRGAGSLHTVFRLAGMHADEPCSRAKGLECFAAVR